LLGLLAAGGVLVVGLNAAQGNPPVVASTIGLAIGVAVSAGLAYVAGMAGIEFTKVIIDVEANTRLMCKQAGPRGPSPDASPVSLSSASSN
jgi:hypothetical protein